MRSARELYWLEYDGIKLPVRGGDSIIGRTPYCTIVLSDPLVSREHALLHLGPRGLSVVDLGSTHGTRVNGRAIDGEPRTLVHGDTLQLADLVIRITTTRASEGRGLAPTGRQPARPSLPLESRPAPETPPRAVPYEPSRSESHTCGRGRSS